MSWLQAVIDVPADRLGAATTCWLRARGWPVISGFHLGAGSTMEVLFQRLDEPSGPAFRATGNDADEELT